MAEWKDSKDFPDLSSVNSGKEYTNEPLTYDVMNKIVYALKSIYAQIFGSGTDDE